MVPLTREACAAEAALEILANESFTAMSFADAVAATQTNRRLHNTAVAQGMLTTIARVLVGTHRLHNGVGWGYGGILSARNAGVSWPGFVEVATHIDYDVLSPRAAALPFYWLSKKICYLFSL